MIRRYVHTSSTPRHFPPFPHTIYFALPMRLGLALHVVIIIRRAPGANEEGCAE